VLSSIRENKREGKEQVRALVAEGLMQIFLSRLVMAIERRLSEPLGIKIDMLEGLDWEEVENRISQSILDLYTTRVEKLADAEGEIQRNIQAIIRRQRESEREAIDLYELAAGISLGTRMAIDARTHQKGFRQVHLLNYVFLAALHMAGKDTKQVAGDILNHLDDVQKRLKGIWGNLELAHLSENAVTVQDLPLQYQYALKQAMGSERFQAFASVPLEELKSIGEPNLADLLGGMVQQAIYKHILLSAISELWIDHLTRMEALRVSIRMEAYAQRDPLVLYKNESTETFKNLLSEIRMGVISRMFRVQPAKPQPAQPDDGVKPQQEKPADSSTKEAKTKRKRHKKR
jgi:preprotein translocase subunit SecA